MASRGGLNSCIMDFIVPVTNNINIYLYPTYKLIAVYNKYAVFQVRAGISKIVNIRKKLLKGSD